MSTRNLLLSEEFSQEEGGQEEEQCCWNYSCPKSVVLMMNYALQFFQLHELNSFFFNLMMKIQDVQIKVK